jgi:hypothetical protein
MADTMKSTALAHRFPAEWVLVFSPEHALTLKKDGCSRKDIQEFILEQASRPLSELIRLGAKAWPEKPGDDQVIRHCSKQPRGYIDYPGRRHRRALQRHH